MYKRQQLEDEEVPEEEVIINEQQAASIEEEKEEITAEKIIEQELLKATSRQLRAFGQYRLVSGDYEFVGCRVSFQRSEYNKNIERRLYMLFYRITNCLSHINIYL